MPWSSRKTCAPSHEYTVVFEPAEEGGYVVTVPALPGCVTEGDTFERSRCRRPHLLQGEVPEADRPDSRPAGDGPVREPHGETFRARGASTPIVNVADAKARLSELIERR